MDVNNSKNFVGKSYDNLVKRDKRLSLQGVLYFHISQLRSWTNTYFIKKTGDDIDILSSLANDLSDDVLDIYRSVIELFFNKNRFLNYNKKSMDIVNDVRSLRNHLNNEKLNRLKLDSSIEELAKFVNIKNNIGIDNKKEVKFSLNSESNLINSIYELVNAHNIHPSIKQISVEDALLNYDLNWFNNQIGNSVDIRSIVLHDIYKKLIHTINKIIKNYSYNNFESLLKDIKSNNVNIKSKAITCLVLIYLGNDKVISLVFSELINLLSQFNTSDDELGVNRTEILFKIARKLFKVCLVIKEDDIISRDNKYLNNLIKIISINEIKNIIKDSSEHDRFYLGDTILNIIINNCNIFNVEVVSDSLHNMQTK